MSAPQELVSSGDLFGEDKSKHRGKNKPPKFDGKEEEYDVYTKLLNLWIQEQDRSNLDKLTYPILERMSSKVQMKDSKLLFLALSLPRAPPELFLALSLPLRSHFGSRQEMYLHRSIMLKPESVFL